MDAVSYELDRRVDLVSDAARETTDGLEALGLSQIRFEPLLFTDVDEDADDGRVISRGIRSGEEARRHQDGDPLSIGGDAGSLGAEERHRAAVEFAQRRSVRRVEVVR